MMLFIWGLAAGGILGFYADNLIVWLMARKAKPPSAEARRILAHMKGR